VGNLFAEVKSQQKNSAAVVLDLVYMISTMIRHSRELLCLTGSSSKRTKRTTYANNLGDEETIQSAIGIR
jgi:hypothetical protein